MSNSDRTLITAFKEIASMCDRISLPTNLKVTGIDKFDQKQLTAFVFDIGTCKQAF